MYERTINLTNNRKSYLNFQYNGEGGGMLFLWPVSYYLFDLVAFTGVNETK